jgi:large subunit ribosomal protein L19
MNYITTDNQIKTEVLKNKQENPNGYIEKNYFNNLANSHSAIKPGNIVRVGYKIPEGEKERIQYYEGIIISVSNRGISKTFKIRRSVQSIGLEQTFLVHSPKIVSIDLKQSSKIRRAKLYFLRNLQGKSARIKAKN